VPIPPPAEYIGHAPGEVRDTLLYQLDRRADTGVTSQKLLNLCIKLRRCSDVLPGITCELLNIPSGSTYGQAAMLVLGRPSALLKT
jgi:hypothetical protein